jgi:hypothetical protein
MAKPRSNPRPRQVVSEEVQRSLLELIQRKFYVGRGVKFAQDRADLLRMVVYWPAKEWFNPKALTSDILIEAAAFQTEPLRHPPAWLGKTVSTHFEKQGERYYAEAKSARSLADHAIATLGKIPVRVQDDVVEQFVAADRLLAASKAVVNRAVKATKQQPVNAQLTML